MKTIFSPIIGSFQQVVSKIGEIAGLSAALWPSGVGLRQMSGGVETVKLVENADVAIAAGIAESKLALSYPTHTAANDPTADQKSALAGTAGAPSGTNKFVTNEDTRLFVSETAETAAFNVAAGATGYADVVFAKTYAVAPKVILSWNNSYGIIYSENFESYNVGDDMTTKGWTWHQFFGATGAFAVVAGKAGECKCTGGNNWAGGFTLDAGAAWSNFTLEFDCVVSNRMIVGFRMGANGYWVQCVPGFALESKVIRAGFDFITGNVAIDSQNPPATLTHVKIVVNGTNIKVYYNGSSTATHDVTDATYSTGTIAISAYQTGWKIDNAVVSNIVGTEQVFLSLSNLTTTGVRVNVSNHHGTDPATGKAQLFVIP